MLKEYLERRKYIKQAKEKYLNKMKDLGITNFYHFGDTGTDDTIFVTLDKDIWKVCYRERDSILVLESFNNEDDAFDYLYNELKKNYKGRC